MIDFSLIVFRESFEAFLITSMVLSIVNISKKEIIAGFAIIFGIILSLVLVAVIPLISTYSWFDSEYLDIFFIGLVIVFLFYHQIWVHSHQKEIKNKAKELNNNNFKEKVSLFSIISLAVAREGMESILFLYGVHKDVSAYVAISSGLAGFISAFVICWVVYRGILNQHIGKIFNFINYLIIILIANLSALLVNKLSGLGLINFWQETAYNTSNIIARDDWAGLILHQLIGYNSNPSTIELATWIVIFLPSYYFFTVKK